MKIEELLDEFWSWMGFKNTEWEGIDIAQLPIDISVFPLMDDICRYALAQINLPLTKDEISYFLMCLAINSEQERILQACITNASADFCARIVSEGVHFKQSDARWQLAEILRKDIPDKDHYLNLLCNDDNAYVRKRAKNVLLENK